MRGHLVTQSRLVGSVKKDRDCSDRELLPLALEILETPVSPIGMSLCYAIFALTVAVLAWSYVCRIDIYAVAFGKIEPIGRSKVVEPAVSGRVVTILVSNGRRVKRGQALIELDSLEANATRDEVLGELADERAEIARREAAVFVAASGNTATKTEIGWISDIPNEIRVRQAGALRADLAQLSATLDNLYAQKHQKEVDRDQSTAAIKAQKAIISVLAERTDMQELLFKENVGSRSNVLQALEEQRRAEAGLVSFERDRAIAEAGMAVIDSEISETRRAFVQENTEKTEASERKLIGLTADLARANLNISRMTLRSPIDGRVQALSVTTVGQFINAGQETMRIVPENAPIEAIAYVSNSDVGFVREGQEVIIKIDSFPYMRYGIIQGVITRVATEAIPNAEAIQNQHNPSLAASGDLSATIAAQHIQDLVYPIVVSLSRPSVITDGRESKIIPGMTVSMEIKTGRRRVIDYILSPFVDVGSSALHER